MPAPAATAAPAGTRPTAATGASTTAARRRARRTARRASAARQRARCARERAACRSRGGGVTLKLRRIEAASARSDTMVSSRPRPPTLDGRRNLGCHEMPHRARWSSAGPADSLTQSASWAVN
jgi:hypothetical protein